LTTLLERKVPLVHHLGNRTPGYALDETPTSPLYRLAAASQWLAQLVRSEGYRLEPAVVYPGAHVDELRMPVAPSRRRLRIAYASLVMPYKGAHVLVDALFELARRGVDFTCTLAGGSTHPGYVETLERAIRGSGLAERFSFPGFLGREELKDLFARSNVLAFPTQVEEAFGISQAEAMAAGLLVVSTGTGGAAEVIEHGVSGLVFEKTSPTALADALEGLVKDRDRWGRIAEAGRRRAFERFDIQRSVDQLEALFTELIATAGGPRA
jgi:glycogen(starch) synthase